MNFKKLFKVAGNSKSAPALQMLWVEKGFAYATDAFKAIRMITSYDPKISGFITKLDASVAWEKTKSYKKLKLPDIDHDQTVVHPGVKIDDLIPTMVTTALKVNRKYLIDLLQAMQESGGGDTMTLKFGHKKEGESDMLVVENDNGVGILMPLKD